MTGKESDVGIARVGIGVNTQYVVKHYRSRQDVHHCSIIDAMKCTIGNDSNHNV